MPGGMSVVMAWVGLFIVLLALYIIKDLEH